MPLTPFDLNLRHLRALAIIRDDGTLSAAAARVGLSQPALTQGIAKLERQLGTMLFDRRPDGICVTQAGEALAQRAEAALAHLASAVRSRPPAARGFATPDRLMTATQLDAFLRIADAGGFAAASAAYGLSPPALHRAVRDLEQVSGVALVERRGRGTVLTQHGHRMARAVRLAHREIAAGIAEISPDPEDAGRIVIGAMPLSRALLLPRALARFTRISPTVVIDVVEGSWRELVDPLRDGVLDMMVGAVRETPSADLDQRPLFTDHLSVIGRAGHPLAAISRPSPEQLARYPWVVGSRGTPLRQQWHALFAGHPLPPAPLECGSVMVIRGILQDSNLLALLSRDQVALEIDAGMLGMIGPPLPDSIRSIGLTTRAAWRPSAAQQRLMNLIEETAKDIGIPKIE
ncbi:LysR family transcriptional regulator [Sphingomonas sp. 37zxx]|uniref:LysR family transcriptional regulator n=1 Tax=Sphingomonas sp. 37zxx TaxID=1550073 RepID=UPI00053BDB05|nr:LysR family transcriptional regulator [Sphingomonas sp. 37zxx]